ncbi:hypothetical protein SAMN04487971_1481 [Paracoccus chinensis]|uniref:Uncharacterized protein n=2 Tax=Paracoccus chinensis TaxID=525640 RepID=A0A1G9P9H5_9RHOB|nr:hypothetical protein SAMN04487971_1481 [Paracoccus chinensis]
MTYPKMPTRLDNAEQIMAWLRLLQADGQSFAEEVSAQVAAGTLTEEISSSYLDKFTWLMAATDKAYAAVEEGDLWPAAGFVDVRLSLHSTGLERHRA